MNSIKITSLLSCLLIIRSVDCIFEEECIGNELKYVPSPNGCEYFIYCAKQAIELKCSDKMYFDKDLMLCEDIDKVICDITTTQSTSSTTITIPTTTIQPSTISSTSTLTSTTQTTALTPLTIPIPIPTSTAGSSTITTIVTPDTTTSSTTTSSTTFSTTTSSTTSSTTLTTPTPTPTKTPTTAITTPTTTITTTTTIPVPQTTSAIISSTTYPTDMAADCRNNDDIDHAIFIPSLSICAKYYFCYHGTPVPMYCAKSLHFNPLTEQCDFVENVNCLLEHPKCTSDVVDFFPHPTQCEYFYYCVNGYQTLQQCPIYTYWDGAKKSCELKTQFNCK